jgi:hypothetical protein
MPGIILKVINIEVMYKSPMDNLRYIMNDEL